MSATPAIPTLEWVTVAQDLFLEHASPQKIAAWLDGEVSRHPGCIAIKRMNAVTGFDATILERDARAVSLVVWYRAGERPTLNDARRLLGFAEARRGHLFEYLFPEATRALDEEHELYVSCALESGPDELIGGIALTVSDVSDRA